jgi:2-oxoglutarate dehydrogenase E2 component (dihydrolipoamide succinyltransferase)
LKLKVVRWLPLLSSCCKSRGRCRSNKTVDAAKDSVATPVDFSDSDKFFSPLVKKYCFRGVSVAELEQINGTGKDVELLK